MWDLGVGVGRGTICDFFAGADEAVCVNDNFLFALDLDDFGATVRRTTVINESRNVAGFSSYIG